MTLKSQIEIAKDATSKALITALQDKDENAVGHLFDVYAKLAKIEIKNTPKNLISISGHDSTVGYHDGNINLNTAGPISSAGTDVITFTSSSLS
jgi:hypothetical protein